MVMQKGYKRVYIYVTEIAGGEAERGIRGYVTETAGGGRG